MSKSGEPFDKLRANGIYLPFDTLRVNGIYLPFDKLRANGVGLRANDPGIHFVHYRYEIASRS